MTNFVTDKSTAGRSPDEVSSNHSIDKSQIILIFTLLLTFEDMFRQPRNLKILFLIAFISSLLCCCNKQDNTQNYIANLKKESKKGAMKFNDGKYDEALDIFKSITENIGTDMPLESKDEIVNALNSLGYLLMFHKQDYLGGFEALTKAKEIGESLPESKFLCYTYVNLATVYQAYGDKRNFQIYTGKGFDEAFFHRKYIVLLTSAFNMLSVGFPDNITPQNRERLKKIQRLDLPDLPLRNVVALMQRAYESNLEGNTEKTLEIIDEIRKLPIDKAYEGRVAELCDIYGATITTRNRLTKEGEIYAARLENGKDTMETDIRKIVLPLLADYYHLKGDDAKGYQYRDEATELSDSIFSAAQYSLLHDFEVRNERERHDQIISKTKQKERKVIFSLVGITVLLVVTAAVAVYIAMQNKKLRQRNRHLFQRQNDAVKTNKELVSLRLRNDELQTKVDELESERLTDPETSPAAESDDERRDENSASTPPEDMESTALRTLTPKVIEIMNSDELVNPDFSLERLTELVHSNRTYVSKVINNIYQKNFRVVLNEIRVERACRLLTDSPIHRKMTVEGLAESVGYRSRSNFIATFKKITGVSPSEYRKASV